LNEAAANRLPLEAITEDFNRSRIHGLENIDALVAEWSKRLPISEETIHTYLTANIHYTLDEECIEGMRVFFRTAASLGILPEYAVELSKTAS
jgi:chorismate dehydratase